MCKNIEKYNIKITILGETSHSKLTKFITLVEKKHKITQIKILKVLDNLKLKI